MLKINNCQFKHCNTKLDKFIQTDIVEKSVFSTKHYELVEVVNCTGLEMVNKEGCIAENVKLKDTNTKGELIGSTLDENSDVGITFKLKDE